MLSNFLAPFKELSSGERKNAFGLVGAYFFALMSYPIIRSSTDAFFIQAHGAKNWPWVTFYATVTLSACIFLFNRAQKKWGVKKLYCAVSFFSAALFFCSALAWRADFTPFAYISYIWKECYVVILVHLCLAFFNSHFSYNFAKSFFGPLGAITSVGAILGGTFTSFATKQIGLFWLVTCGAAICLITPLFFSLLSEQAGRVQQQHPPPKKLPASAAASPLESVRGLWPYLASIIGIVAITQLIINIVNFKFNWAVQEHFPLAVDKTVFFGKVYTTINAIAFVIQIALTPIALRSLAMRTNHLLVAGGYLLGLLPLFILQGHMLAVVAAVFIASKAIDYSFFGVIKEMLYYPLDEYQKYGAKYIIDMVMYRASKGLVSLVLTQIQNFKVLNALMVAASLAWVILVFHIFRIHARLCIKKT